MAINYADASSLMQSMHAVQHYKNSLESLNKQLAKTTLTGKINSLNVAETLMEYMEKTQERFAQLQKRLIENLVNENLQKVVLESGSKAQVAIDILIRNLFERTADVGFLATDDDLRNFMLQEQPDEESREFVRQRMKEYVQKYSVYDEIVLLSVNGEVKAHLDESSPISICRDPLIAKTIASNDDFVETFGPSDIRPRLPHTLIYSCKIREDLRADSRVIGVLCLCFKFDDEMKSIFCKLLNGSGAALYLLDGSSRILASSKNASSGMDNIRRVTSKPYEIVKNSSGNFLAATRKTVGYQGFFGLDWYAHVCVPLKTAFAATEAQSAAVGDEVLENSRLFSEELKLIKTQAEEINDDLSGIVLNGEIIASKQKAYELNPVLDNIRNISENMSATFAASINDLQKTVVTSFLNDVKFLASLSIEIMDRNLYERANDCRWWALTSDFRTILAKGVIEDGDVELITQILSYINRLYTVYTNLFVFDSQGVVLAVSNPKEHALVGQKLHGSFVTEALYNRDSQKYFVSSFDSTSLYGDRHTYIYSASITDMQNPQTVVGGIGVVFDSQPQFEAMLSDSLPKDDRGNVLADCFGVFVERSGRIIATSDTTHKIGDQLRIEQRFLSLPIGSHEASVMAYNGSHYAIGCAVSNGYREYKIEDGYVNDITAVFFLKL